MSRRMRPAPPSPSQRGAAGLRPQVGGARGTSASPNFASLRNDAERSGMGVVDEDEIEDKDLAEIQSLETTLLQQREKLRVAKQKHKKRKQQQMHIRAEELQKRLEDLEKAEDVERKDRIELKNKLAKLRDAESRKGEEDHVLNEELWSIERDNQMEEVARLRMQAAQLMQKREKVERLLDNATVQVTAVEQERMDRGQNNVKRLEEILDKADKIKEELDSGAFTAEELRNHATALQEQAATGKPAGEGGEMFKLSDEVATMRRKQRERASQKREERSAILSRRRKDIYDQQVALRRKRRQMKQIFQKGTDYLVEVELGAAPPMEYLLANISVRDDSELRHDDEASDSDDEEPVRELVEEVKKSMMLIEPNIRKLRHDQKSLEVEREFAKGPFDGMKPYAGEKGVRSYDVSQMADYRMCIKIVRDLADEVCDEIFSRPTYADAKREQDQWDRYSGDDKKEEGK